MIFRKPSKDKNTLLIFYSIYFHGSPHNHYFSSASSIDIFAQTGDILNALLSKIRCSEIVLGMQIFYQDMLSAFHFIVMCALFTEHMGILRVVEIAVFPATVV